MSNRCRHSVEQRPDVSYSAFSPTHARLERQKASPAFRKQGKCWNVRTVPSLPFSLPTANRKLCNSRNDNDITRCYHGS